MACMAGYLLALQPREMHAKCGNGKMTERLHDAIPRENRIPSELIRSPVGRASREIHVAD